MIIMDKALVLLSLESSAEAFVLDELRKLDGVVEAHFLYGPYDAYVMIVAKDSGALHEVVINSIRGIEGISSTMTCFIAD